MTVPSSGEISLGKIRQELESTGTGNDYDQGPYTSAETSLSSSSVGIYDTINTGSEDRPNASAPFKMSEWRGYDHHAAWEFTWDQDTTHHGYPHISASKTSQNTAPNGTVADQILISGSLRNYSAAQFTGNSAYAGHPEILVVFWVEESGSLPESAQPVFTVARGGDPGVDGTDNTKALVKQFGNDTKLLVTTIQKLNNAISSSRYADVMEKLKDEKIVFIFEVSFLSKSFVIL